MTTIGNSSGDHGTGALGTVSLQRLFLHEYRCFADATLEPDRQGTTVLTGPNGSGKTTILEAVAYLATQRSFRNAPREAVVRAGSSRAVVRAELDHGESRVLVEGQILRDGPSRCQVNRHVVRTRRELADAVPVTVFSPDDLALVQAGPAHRRDLLDDALDLLDVRASRDADDLRRVLRQRAALLRQAGGRLTPDVATTLAVWDDRLVAASEGLVAARTALVSSLAPFVAEAYAALAGTTLDAAPTRLAYHRSWEGDLRAALEAGRHDDLRRGVTTVGPHRDDVELWLAGRQARSQASQGEQRCFALALRLAVHRLVGERTGRVPVLLLDDVFSELDLARSRALLRELPAGQTLVTTAVDLPADVEVARLVDVRDLARSGGCPSAPPTADVESSCP